jgi:hypothetical protein
MVARADADAAALMWMVELSKADDGNSASAA